MHVKALNAYDEVKPILSMDCFGLAFVFIPVSTLGVVSKQTRIVGNRAKYLCSQSAEIGLWFYGSSSSSLTELDSGQPDSRKENQLARNPPSLIRGR